VFGHLDPSGGFFVWILVMIITWATPLILLVWLIRSVNADFASKREPQEPRVGSRKEIEVVLRSDQLLATHHQFALEVFELRGDVPREREDAIGSLGRNAVQGHDGPIPSLAGTKSAVHARDCHPPDAAAVGRPPESRLARASGAGARPQITRAAPRGYVSYKWN